MLRPPRRFTLVPYPPLFRSQWIGRRGPARSAPFPPGRTAVVGKHVALLGNLELLGRRGTDLLPVQQNGVLARCDCSVEIGSAHAGNPVTTVPRIRVLALRGN